MFGKTLGFLSSEISTMSLSGQSSKQPLGEQSNQNPWNKLSHTSFGTYPPKPLNNPPSTMHKWGYKNIWRGEHFIDANLKTSKAWR
jgi:hypothetical protein